MSKIQDDIKLVTFIPGKFIIPLFITQTVICLDDIKKNIELYVIPEKVMNVDLLIGQNFTELDDVQYLKRGNLLKFTYIESKNKTKQGSTLDLSALNVGIEDRQAISTLLELLNEFRDCIALKLSELGEITVLNMKLTLTTNQPVCSRPHRLAQSERILVQKMVQEMLDNNIIRPSHSPYASPIVLVGKKTGDKRLCIDYRALNNITVKDKYPLPVIEDHIDRLHGYKYFISLDLFTGFYQIPMSPESIPYTAFVTPDGLYEFLRMPMGLSNSPSVFQRMVNIVFSELRFSKILVYIDDILIPARTVDEALSILREVLQLMRKHGLTLKLSKCFFLQTHIEYLGYTISESEIKPGKIKTEAVEKFPPPQDVHQVRQFLGLTGYFRKFIPDYARKSRSLSALLHKDHVWQWGEQENNAFLVLKQCLISQPVLRIFNQKLNCVLYTDASRLGLAGILTQSADENKNKEWTIAYFSRQTRVTEQQYHSFELETLAVVESVKHFRHYLLGKHFTILTDCSAVRHSFLKKDINMRIARWVMALTEFSFDIKHRPGGQMQHVDCLSRNPPVSKKTIAVTIINKEDWLLATQTQDKMIKALQTILKSGEVDKNRGVFNDYVLKGEVVYRNTPRGPRRVAPKGIRFQLCHMNHDEIGHFAFNKTYEIIASKYWFPKMRNFIKKYLRNCLNCLYFKSVGGRKPGFLHPIPKIPIPFHTIHVDHVGPFVKTKTGNSHLFVIIDAFTKFILIYAVKGTKTELTIKSLKDCFKNFGVPRRLISDPGSSFTSHKFKEFVQSVGMTHHLTAVGLPRGNGQVERYNQTILESLAAMGMNVSEKRWDENLMRLQVGLNSTINDALGVSPSEALLGVRVSLHGAKDPIVESYVDVTKVRKAIVERIQTQQEEQKERFDKTRYQPKPIAVNDLVMIRVTSFPATGSSRKLLPKWRGPFQVSRILANDRYEVAEVKGSQRSQIPYLGVAGIDNIKPWVHDD